LLVALVLECLACPGEGSRELADEIGGAPKRQIDQAKEAIDRAVDQKNESLEDLGKER